MRAVLLIGGLGLLVLGLVAIGFGIQDKEFSFGHTLILAGAIAACTGIVLLGLWSVVRELRNTAGQLLGRVLPNGSVLTQESPHDVPEGQGVERGDFVFARDPQSSMAGSPELTAPTHSAQPMEEGAPRARRSSDLPRREKTEAGPAEKPRRNLLFSSTSRKERDRAQARTSEPAPEDPVIAVEPNVQPFDDPRQDRAGDGEARSPRRGRASGGAEIDRQAGQTLGQPDVTVLKSGVVDGMAYSLYSDGSIEAQMPEGMMRFASIDELRAHLDQRP
jgi:hypothetical protein